MAIRFERIDADTLKVIHEVEGTRTRKNLMDTLIALQREKQIIQADIDKVMSQLSVLDRTGGE